MRRVYHNVVHALGWRRRPRYPRNSDRMQDTQPYRRPRQAQAQRVRRAAPKVRRPANWRRRILVVFVVVIAAAATGAFLLWQRAVAFNDAVSTA